MTRLRTDENCFELLGVAICEFMSLRELMRSVSSSSADSAATTKGREGASDGKVKRGRQPHSGIAATSLQDLQDRTSTLYPTTNYIGAEINTGIIPWGSRFCLHHKRAQGLKQALL